MIIEWLRLEKISEGRLVNPSSSSKGHLELVVHDHVQMAFELSPRMESSQPPWTTCASACFPHREAIFPVVWTEPTVLAHLLSVWAFKYILS